MVLTGMLDTGHLSVPAVCVSLCFDLELFPSFYSFCSSDSVSPDAFSTLRNSWWKQPNKGKEFKMQWKRLMGWFLRTHMESGQMGI